MSAIAVRPHVLFLTERGEGDILVPGEDTTTVGLALSVTQEDPETHLAGAAGRALPLVPRLDLRTAFALGVLALTFPNSPEASAPRMRSSATRSMAVSGRELSRRSTSG